jgi:transposase
MYIECFNNNGNRYLRLTKVTSYQEDGVRKTRRQVIRNIGPLSRYDDGKPDYLQRLRKSFKVGHPIIESLADLSVNTLALNKVTIDFDLDRPSDYYCHPKNIGYFILDSMYDGLGIYDVYNLAKFRNKVSFDLVGNTKLLIFSRLLKPDSKLKTFADKDTYLFPLTKSDRLQDIYDTLDYLDTQWSTTTKRMDLKIKQHLGRNPEICYYDVTNYYFEISENDHSGLRRKGVSKENRRSPLVQMGLFMDENGIPICYHLFPGNQIDQTTLRPVMKTGINKLGYNRVIIVADGGVNSDKNIAHILTEGNGYVLSRSTKKSTKKMKAWLLDEADYLWNSNESFKVKSQIREREIVDENDQVMLIKEKVVSYWSRSHYTRQLKENQAFLEYLETVTKFPDKLKDKDKKIDKFLIKQSVIKETGEVVNTKNVLSLDLDKIKEYLDLLGYYTIYSSEIDKRDEEIIGIYHGLSKIEDSFRITKSDLEGRPVFVRTPTHINAHFLICFIALTMIRIIQYKILVYLGLDTKNVDGWESGLSAKRIQKALLNWRVDALPKGYFRATAIDPDLDLILKAFGVQADLRLPDETTIRRLKSAIDKAFICL